MDLVELLRQRFSKPSVHRRVVIWNDPDGEQDLDELREALQPLGVRVWEWTEDNSFRTKYQLEIADPEAPYLVYARFARPPVHEDWLLDIRLYGEEFVADQIALLMERLRVSRPAVRDFLTRHRAFFRNQERVRRVERLLPERPREDQVILAALAAAAGVDAPDMMLVTRRVLSLELDEAKNAVYQQLVKWELADEFWAGVQETFGLPGETGSLRDLFYALAASHLAQGLGVPLPEHWDIPVSRMPNACRMFLDDALRIREGEAFRAHLSGFAMAFGVVEWLRELPYEICAGCDTLPEIHELLLRHLCDELLHGVADAKRWRAILAARQGMHGYEDWMYGYEALDAALSLQEEKNAFASAPPPADAKAWFDGYVTRWYRVDQLYRQFCAAVEMWRPPDWFSPLKERWDNWYVHTFLVTCGEWTDRALKDGLAGHWPIPGVRQQRRFFAEFVADHLARERVFVLISDALRYEAGQELADRLRRRLHATVDVEPLQASLPTYTRLGMASLLPGRTFAVSESGAVHRDGLPTDTLKAREGILAAQEQGAVVDRLVEFERWPVQVGEEKIRGKRVVYLYHDVIDAIGDQGRSEAHTFLAVRQALEELERAVEKLVRSYRAVRILVTSDHGFLFQPGAVEAWAKPQAVTGHIYDGNRRFAVGRSLSAPPGTVRVSLQYLGLDVEAVIASSIHRLTVSGGGQRYVHGGAMPQEAIIPVIVCRQPRSRGRGSGTSRVDVVLANRGRIVTAYEYTAILFQEQRVGDGRMPRHLRIALYLDGVRISTEVTRVFDSQGEPAEREVSVPLHLFERDYPLGALAKLRLDDVSEPDTALYREYDMELRIAPLP